MGLEEFQRMLRRPDVKATLRSFDVDLSQATTLFRLMDENNSMTISAKEFITGCTRLRSQARGIDLWQIRLQNKEIIRNLKSLFGRLQQHFEGVDSSPRLARKVASRPVT